MSGFIWYHNPLDTTVNSSNKLMHEKQLSIKNYSPYPKVLVPNLKYYILLNIFIVNNEWSD